METTDRSGISPKHHVVIAGTGRAGTSFLVRYLTACGLETQLSQSGDAESWNESANAGLETLPLVEGDLPYVIKQPWLYEFAEEFFQRDDVRIDAAVIPIRDLTEASRSRVITEMQAMHERNPGITCSGSTWKTWANTPGGVVYSLHPLDEARILALGFHDLVGVLVKHGIPIVFLSFPRFIEDGIYLYEQMRRVLPVSLTLEAALAAHTKTADSAKVRVDKEISHGADLEHLTLDNAALKRELRRINAELQKKTSELSELRRIGPLGKLRRALGRVKATLQRRRD